ncbi:hypothetical protein COOONC_05277 [Cooperia oncophora]
MILALIAALVFAVLSEDASTQTKLFMILALIAALVFAVLSEDASTQTKDAFLVASKSPQSIYAVENMDLILEYGLYNIGDKAALKHHAEQAKEIEIM